MKCLIEELDKLDILPWGWVMLRRTPNTDPEDGFIEVKYTGDIDLIEQNNALLRVARAADYVFNAPSDHAGKFCMTCLTRMNALDRLELALKEVERLLEGRKPDPQPEPNPPDDYIVSS